MKKTCAGFTLIQLLLVIIIIAIIASLEIALTSSKTATLKVQKSAVQIQQLLQAAINYRKDNNKWPVSFRIYANYIPLTLSNNYQISDPWGGKYALQATASDLSISITNNNKNNLSGMAQLLPNVTIIAAGGGKYKLTTKISKDLPSSRISAVGIAQDGDQIPVNCQNPTIILAPNEINMQSPSGAVFFGYPIKTLNLTTKNCGNAVCLDGTIYTLNSSYTPFIRGKASALYIVKCEAPS